MGMSPANETRTRYHLEIMYYAFFNQNGVSIMYSPPRRDERETSLLFFFEVVRTKEIFKKKKEKHRTTIMQFLFLHAA